MICRHPIGGTHHNLLFGGIPGARFFVGSVPRIGIMTCFSSFIVLLEGYPEETGKNAQLDRFSIGTPPGKGMSLAPKCQESLAPHTYNS